MIIESLPPKIFNLLSEIEKIGFSLCLVGGYTRDFFYFETVGNDLDFEIRPIVKLDNAIASWPDYYKNLHQFLTEKKIPYTEFPYLITKVKFENVYLEFSSPRTEKNLDDNYTHHHFEAILDPELSYDLSFKRRDFTINAIGVELNLKERTETVIDPFLGLKDLENGLLRNISDDFFLDSVRFLRLVRFKLKFEKFQIEDKLLNQLNKFNLSNLSIHHFKEELFKSRPGSYLNKFKELILEKKLSLPDNFKVWTKYKFPENVSTKDEILAYVYLQNFNDANIVAQFFSLPDKRLKDLNSFYSSYEVIKLLNNSDFCHLLTLPLEVGGKHSILKDLKNLEDKKEWRSVLNSLGVRFDLILDWDDWSKTNVDGEELQNLAPELRSNYLFYKTIRAKFAND